MNTPINIFLDPSKAFDSLDKCSHNITKKNGIKYHAIHLVTHKLMESDITN